MATHATGCLDNIRRWAEKAHDEKLNHERPIKGLPVSSIGDGAETRKPTATGKG